MIQTLGPAPALLRALLSNPSYPFVQAVIGCWRLVPTMVESSDGRWSRLDDSVMRDATSVPQYGLHPPSCRR